MIWAIIGTILIVVAGIVVASIVKTVREGAVRETVIVNAVSLALWLVVFGILDRAGY